MQEVQDSRELRRIISVPRRVWTEDQSADLAHRLTAVLAVPEARTDCPVTCPCGGKGSMSLRPIQAVALVEMAQWGGGFFPIRVGGGKTLISMLGPRMFGDRVQRPLVLLPAHLRDKTRDEMQALRKHWILPAFIRIESYQTLSRVGSADFLAQYQPDLILADEAHYLKNPSAAVTKRVARYVKQNRDRVTFVAMSGTVTKRSIRDFAHVISWALPHTNPAPEDFHALDEWSRALDVNVAEHRRLKPGALVELRENPMEDIRVAYRRRLVQSPGVVATQEGPLPIPLRLQSHTLNPLPEKVSQAFQVLREAWETPDGWPIADGVAMWRHARELAHGFYYRWNPRPPQPWIDARRDWASECRDILSNNRRHLDSEMQVVEAVRLGLYPHATEYLLEWEQIEPSFSPNVEAVWLSDHSVEWISRWAKEAPGIVWVGHTALGERLALHGLPYYANQGIDAKTNARIEGHNPSRGSLVASIHANATGRNLQRWSRNLLADPPINGSLAEQLLGRTHRDGQNAPEVTAELLFGCIENVEGFWRAVKDAEYAEAMTGQAQKLVHADIEDVEETESARLRFGPQWKKIL